MRGDGDLDPVFADGRSVIAHLFDQRQHGRPEGQRARQQSPLQHRRTHIEKLLGRGIGENDHALRVHADQRARRSSERSSATPGVAGGRFARSSLLVVLVLMLTPPPRARLARRQGCINNCSRIGRPHQRVA